MDANNQKPAASGGKATMETSDWRAQLQPDARQRILNKIMETLKQRLPFSGKDELQKLEKIAVRFEEKIYSVATDQTDYLRKISFKMLTIENKSLPNTLLSNAVGSSSKPPDPGVSHNVQPQVNNHGQSLPVPLSVNQSQGCEQLPSHNMQNNIASSGVQSSAGLPSALPTASSLNQSPISNIVGQNTNMQVISSIPQNSVGNLMGQGVPTNNFANQRQMPGRQQVSPQQQQPSQNPQHYLDQQQIQKQLMKQKLQQGNLPHRFMQQQQKNLLEPTQLQSSQQSGIQTSFVMQPSMMQSGPLSNLQQSTQSIVQQNQPSSAQQSTQLMQQQHPQSVLRQLPQPQQASGHHQQQAPMMHQQLMGQQNSTSMQQNLLIGQQNSVGDMQQQQQRLLDQQNNLQSLPQQQHLQQQLMPQQNNFSNIHQEQLGPQNVPSLQQPQQQQLLGTQSGNMSMQTNQHSMNVLQQSKISLQSQPQQSATNLLPTQEQQSQPQPLQPQMMSQSQSQPAQLQQQLGLQQQSNQLQQRLQAADQAPASLLQPQNVIDQQKQLHQSQRALPETSSASLDSAAETGHTNGVDWPEDVYQKIKAMKETYYPELNELYQKVAAKLQQHESLPQQPNTDQFEKLKIFKAMLERSISLLQVSKSNITPSMKDNLPSYEKQIINFISTNRPRKPIPSLQQGQLPQSHMQAMQESQSQIPQVQLHESQLSPELQTMNLQGSVPAMQQNNMSSMQHNSLSSLSGICTSQQMRNAIQPGSNINSGQENVMGSLQQIPVGSPQQNAVSAPQWANINTILSQNGVNVLQPNILLQSNSNMLQHQHLKQQQEHRMLQTQQLKLHQMQQLMKQRMLQQQQQQQLPAQMQIHQVPQLLQMTDPNQLKIRQNMDVKPGVFQQHLSSGQCTAYPQQQSKQEGSFPISSPQMLPAASLQLSQHSSPQVDQQYLLPSLMKTGTPLQSTNSPFIVPSTSTPLAPSPALGDSEKPMYGFSSLSNSGKFGHQQTIAGQTTAPSLASSNPGISASPLLAEFTGPDGAHGTALTTVSSKPNVTEQPIERLIKAVKSVSPQALGASITDIGSVVCMIDRIAGEVPGNGPTAAVGEDLAATTKCSLQEEKNFIAQDGMSNTRKMQRHLSALPLNVLCSAGSTSGSYKQLTWPEASDLESTAMSSIKRPRIEVNHALLDEIWEINQQLVDTVVHVSDKDVDHDAAVAAAPAEGSEGTIVKCSFRAVALSPNLKSLYASAQTSPIQPLRLLVPRNYPNCSPILLDKLPFEVSNDCEDLSEKAKSRLSAYLRRLLQPMSVSEIARSWDACARAVICEHAQQFGGGSFSSKYGTWDRLSGA